MGALADIADFEDRLGRPLAGAEALRAVRLLEDVSASIRRRTGQTFTAGTSTVVLSAQRGRLSLPQRPVTAVTSVTALGGGAAVFTWWAGDSFLMLGSATSGFEYEPFRSCSGQRFTVVYEHGGDVPAELVGVCCQIAGRALGVSSESGGVQQESLGSYSYSVGSAAASGAFGMLPAELALVDSFRPTDTIMGTISTRPVWA